MGITGLFRNLENGTDIPQEEQLINDELVGQPYKGNDLPGNDRGENNEGNNANPAGFVASKNRHKFHRRGCELAAYILPSPNLVEFSTQLEAIDAGYKPCRTYCRRRA